MKEKTGGIAVRLHFLLAATLLFMVMCFTSSALADDQPPGTGTVDDPYQIGTLDELYWFVDYVNASKLTDEEKLNAHNAVLTADIVVNNGVMSEDSIRAVEWVPINNYNAIFDGQGHTISGISYKSSATEIGVFARMDTSSAVIKNLGVINSYINGTGHYIGGICGISYGTIENCYYKGTVAGNSTNATNSTVNSVNYCDVFIGGICGRTGGQIINCYNEAEIKATNPSSNSGGVRVFVGGIAGASNSDSVISMCNNKGSVKVDLNVSTYDVISETGGITGTSYGTIEKCYNTGYVNSSVINQISSTYSKRSNYNWVGGISGYAYSGIIKDCYNIAEIFIGTQQKSSVTRFASFSGGIAGHATEDFPIINCYNTGFLGYNVQGMEYVKADQREIGLISGYNGNLDNCYSYRASSTAYYNGNNGTEKSKNVFASGEIAYLLNDGVSVGIRTWIKGYQIQVLFWRMIIIMYLWMIRVHILTKLLFRTFVVAEVVE